MESKEYSIISPESNSNDDLIIYNMKLTDELVTKLMKGQKDFNNLQGIEFIHTDKGTDLLKIGMESFPFMKVKENQPVHLLTNPSKSSNKLHFLGPVTHKLNPKLELEASKAEAIRQRSQEAEKERLARKTVELDVIPAGQQGSKGQKRLIKRRPSITSGTNANMRSNTTCNTPVTHSLRTRIIQILAIGPISIDQLTIKSNCTQEMVKPFLKELCLDCGADLKCLQLNPEKFGEVTVTEWPYYSMRERDIVTRNLQQQQSRNPVSTLTPPETPETKQTVSINLPQRPIETAATSVPSSAKKGASVKDRLNAIMKRRK